MNFLAIYQDELQADGNRAVLQDARALRAIEVHELEAGLTISALVIGGLHYKAHVEKVSPSCVEISLQDSTPALKNIPVELIVAVPRPQTLRKVIQTAATFGVETLHLIRAENVVKSYLSSKRLADDAIEEDLLLGIEQSGTSFFPKVQIHKRFHEFVEDYLPNIMSNASGIIADTHIPQLKKLSECNITKDKKTLIAIGPESGWNLYEVNKFQELGFEGVTLGQRIFRVETACVSLLAQWQMIFS